MSRIESEGLSPEELQTVNHYDKNARLWDEAHRGESWYLEEMDLLQDHLPTGRILEVGSGGGIDASELAKRGYEYIGTDITPSLIKVAETRNPNLSFVNYGLYNLGFDSESFDGFWAAAVFIHIPKRRVVDGLRNLKKIVRPNGVGFISLKKGNGEIIESNTGRFWALYQPEEFESKLAESGLTVVERVIRRTGTENDWLRYLVKIDKSKEIETNE